MKTMILLIIVGMSLYIGGQLGGASFELSITLKNKSNVALTLE